MFSDLMKVVRFDDKPNAKVAAFFILAPVSEDAYNRLDSGIQEKIDSGRKVFVFSQAFTLNVHQGLKSTTNLAVFGFNNAGSFRPTALVRLTQKFAPLGVTFIHAPTQLPKTEKALDAFNEQWMEGLMPKVNSDEVDLLPAARVAIVSWQQRGDAKVEGMSFNELVGHCHTAKLGPNKDPPFDPLLVWLAINFLRTGKWPCGIAANRAITFVQTVSGIEIPQVQLVDDGKPQDCLVLSWDPKVKGAAIESAIQQVMKSFSKDLFDCLSGKPLKGDKLSADCELVFEQDIYDQDNVMSFLLLVFMTLGDLVVLSVGRSVPDKEMVLTVRAACAAQARSPAFALAASGAEDLQEDPKSESPMTPPEIALALCARGVPVAGGRQPVPGVPAITKRSFQAVVDESVMSFKEFCEKQHSPKQTKLEAEDVARYWAMVAATTDELKGRSVTVVDCGAPTHLPLGCMIHTLVQMFPCKADFDNYPDDLRKLMEHAEACGTVGPDGRVTYVLEGGSQCPE